MKAPAAWTRRLDPVVTERWQGTWQGRCERSRLRVSVVAARVQGQSRGLACAGRWGRDPGSSEPGRRLGHVGPARLTALPTGTCCLRLGTATRAAVASELRSDCPAARQPQPRTPGTPGRDIWGEQVGSGTDADAVASATWRRDCPSTHPTSNKHTQRGRSETQNAGACHPTRQSAATCERFAHLPLLAGSALAATQLLGCWSLSYALLPGSRVLSL